MGKRKPQSSSSSSSGFDLMAMPVKIPGPSKTQKKFTTTISSENPVEQRRQTIREMRAFFTLSKHNEKFLISLKDEFTPLLDIIAPLAMKVLLDSSDDYNLSIMNLDNQIKNLLKISVYEKGGIGDFCKVLIPKYQFINEHSALTSLTLETFGQLHETATGRGVLLNQFEIFRNDLQPFFHGPGYVPPEKPRLQPPPVIVKRRIPNDEITRQGKAIRDKLPY